MANKTDLSTKTFNQAIADASNYIGQKLFAYITNGKHINDRIREKFKKSLIFIGDEGQIYNPLTNTYVGIGQTAYTHTITYIEDAHEKIDQLNKMLTSSMVQSIYANWDQEVWDNMGSEDATKNGYIFGAQDKIIGDVKARDLLPSKIYATNDIVLRGIGDYDPVTKLAYTHEIAHIKDPNSSDKAALEGSFIKTNPKGAFATSGITVTLNKGLNRYMFTYTFMTPTCIAGANPAIFTEDDKKKAKNPDSPRDPFTKQVTLYFTTDEYTKYFGINGTEKIDITPNENSAEYIIKNFWGDTGNAEADDLVIGQSAALREDADTKAEDKGFNPFKAFVEGLKPVYDDAWKVDYSDMPETITGDAVAKWQADYRNWWKTESNLRNQLFKQNTNTITIDDTLTWSYVASAYSYTLDFSRKYTDNQVNRIYRDILGESSTRLIPVGREQIELTVVNDKAKIDGKYTNESGDEISYGSNRYTFAWDETNGWITEELKDNYQIVNIAGKDTLVKEIGKDSDNNPIYREADSIIDFSENLTKYVLNDSSVFVAARPTPGELYSNEINDISADIAGAVVYPWFVLKTLTDKIEEYTAYIETAYFLSYNAKPTRAQVIRQVLDKFSCSWATTYADGKPKTNDFIGSNITNLDLVYFMDWEADTNYATVTVKYITDEVDNNGNNIIETKYINIDGETGKYYDDPANDDPDKDYTRKTSNNENFKGTTTGSGSEDKETTLNGQYARPGGGDWGAAPTLDYGYHGVKYSGDNIFRIIDDLIDLKDPKLDRGYFVVNNKWTPMDNFNLADGIQTLKEVAYVLDMITDGWGNHYGDGDAESNGILLTYTIANNHDRIVDHERRLTSLESGNNVVKGIGKLDHLTSEFVRINLQSDRLWRFQQIIGAEDLDKFADSTDEANYDDRAMKTGESKAPGFIIDEILAKDTDNYYKDYHVDWDWEKTLWAGTYANGKTPADISKDIPYIPTHLDWLGLFETDGAIDHPHANDNGDLITGDTYNFKLAQIPSYIIAAYNTAVRAYIMESRYHTLFDCEGKPFDKELPKWNDVYNGTADHNNLTTIVAATVWPDNLREQTGQDTYTFASPDKRYIGIHSYVGHVGIGIELKLAQTTFVHQNLHGEEGLEFVDINTSDKIKKVVNIDVELPGVIEVKTLGTVLKNDEGKTIKYANTDYVNEYQRTNDTNQNLRYQESNFIEGEKVSDGKYSLTWDRLLKVLGYKDKELLAEKFKTYNLGTFDAGAFTLNTACVTIGKVNVTIVNKIPYATFGFTFTINPNDAVNDPGGATPRYTKRIYSSIGKIYTEGSESEEGKDGPFTLIPTKGEKHDAFTEPIPSNNQFWLRLADNNEKEIADTSVEGLTTSKWVQLYVDGATEGFTRNISKVQHDTYQYAKGLIDGLDSEFLGRRGQVVIGLKQREGIVTPITQDLPETEVDASVSFWGENTNDRKQYEGVTTEQITKQEITLDTPLFIAPTDKYDYILISDGAEDHTTLTVNDNFTVSFNGVDEPVYDAPGAEYAFDESSVHINYIKDSVAHGSYAAVYVPVYIRQQAYVRIDGAQLKWNITNAAWEYKVPTGEVDGDNNPIYDVYTSTDDKDTSKILKLKTTQQVSKERKYISASTVRQSDEYGGIGKNVTKITAHVTKLSDATVDNSGLVDAYDVKETLENLFEWVDLSRYDVDGEIKNLINPVNTEYLEGGGYRDDKTRIADAIEFDTAAYPRPQYTDDQLLDKGLTLDNKLVDADRKKTEFAKTTPDIDETPAE